MANKISKIRKGQINVTCKENSKDVKNVPVKQSPKAIRTKPMEYEYKTTTVDNSLYLCMAPSCTFPMIASHNNAILINNIPEK